MHARMLIDRLVCRFIFCLMIVLTASNSPAAESSWWGRILFGYKMEESPKPPKESEYDRVVRLLNEEKSKVEERLRQCDAIAERLSEDYAVTYKDYRERMNEELKKELLDFLKITKKRQLALPKYRAECGDMIDRINLQLRRLGQERIIPQNIINTFENFNQTVSKLLGSDFFDFATRYDITDAEVARLILDEAQRYDRLMEEGEDHLHGKRYGDAETSFTRAMQVEGYTADEKARVAVVYARLMKDGEEDLSKKRYRDALVSFEQAMLLEGYNTDVRAQEGAQKANRILVNDALTAILLEKAKSEKEKLALLAARDAAESFILNGSLEEHEYHQEIKNPVKKED